MKHLPAIKTTLLFVFGIMIGKFIALDFSHWPWILTFYCLLISILCFLTNNTVRQWTLALTIITTGWIRIDTMQWFPANHIINLLDKHHDLTIKAHLNKNPECRVEKTILWLTTDSILTEDGFRPFKGSILLNQYQNPLDSLFYGDQILLTGKLISPASQRNPGGFDYRAYLKTRNVSGIFIQSKQTSPVKTGLNNGNALLRLIVYPIRRQITRLIKTIFKDDSEILLKALILGDRTDMPEEMRQTFSQIGIIHILAVSGLHVGFVLLLLQTLLKLIRLPQPWQTLFIIFGLILYCLITEGKPPVVRATIMVIVYLIGKMLERQSNSFNTLGVAALILLFINPLMLFDVGFLLSFSAVFSILYFYPKWKTLPLFDQCNAWCISRRGIRQAWLLFLVSLSAQIGTLPVIISTFNRMPVFGVLANLFAVPLAGLIVAYGFITLIFYPISVWIAMIYGAFTDILVRLLTMITDIFHAIPHTNIPLPTPNIFHILLYFCLLLLIFYWRLLQWRKRLIIASLICINLTVWHAALTSAAIHLSYVQLDVGQGDAAIIHLPKHRTLVIDGGDRTPWFDAGQRVLIPYLRQKGIRKIEAVILTHAHNDHVGGLIPLMNEFHINQVIVGDTLSRLNPMPQFFNTIKDRQIPLQQITAFDSLVFPGTVCYFVSPDQTMRRHQNINNRSLVTLIAYGKHRFLFMGDAEYPVENHLIRSVKNIKADVIKIGHHGSKTSSGLKFIHQIHPTHAIISVGAFNRFGHPDSTTIHRLHDEKIQVHRTDQEGAVIFQSDGDCLKQQTWRSKN